MNEEKEASERAQMHTAQISGAKRDGSETNMPEAGAARPAAPRPESKASLNKRRKRESLLANAFELFTQKGIADTTISDIVEKSGVAKGTFYLYFKDKYDLRDRLIRHETEKILEQAYQALLEEYGSDAHICVPLEDQVIFFADHTLTQLSENRILLRFIAKNLSWPLLKHDLALIDSPDREPQSFAERLEQKFRESSTRYRNPEILLYMIVEFIGSTCYSSILEEEPCPIEELKPYLLDSVRSIMRSQQI